ncbi:MAG: single-stranded DNA-binding protein [Elusimicrobiota bacterium]|jgi:single-strand DNA-binding protein
MASAGVRFPEVNVIVVSGRIVRDGESAFTPSGVAKNTMRIAVNRRVKDSKTGEWKDDTFFIDVIAWRDLAERAKDRAKKGVPIVVEGRLSGREYEKDGQKRSAFEIVANRIQFLSLTGAEGPAPKAAGGAPAADAGDLEEVPF